MLLNGETLDTLVSVRVSVDPHHLEDLLETLAGLNFPVNPELIHSTGPVAVEFPAYTSHIDEINRMLSGCGFKAGPVSVTAWGVAPE